MADTAISAGEFPTQHREHLPRQQPQQPLRRNTTATNTPTSTSAAPPAGGSAPPAMVDTTKYRSSVRPLSMTVGPRDAGGMSSMGPHPGAGHLARVNSTGSGVRTGTAYDRQQSYLQQRASGTPDERVFNANGQQAAAAKVAAAAAAAKVAAAAAAGIVPHREVHYANEYPAAPAAPQPVHRSSGSSRRMVGPYQLAKTIGAGSMGKVKVALDIRTNKRVAAKIIPRQQPDVPIYFPSGFDTTAANSSEKAVAASVQIPPGPVDPAIEPWRSWLIPLALESRPDLAEQSGYPARVPRKLRLLQPRERFTTKDRERRENKDIRIVREVAINRLLHHPNICVLHDVIVHPNHYYIFQELVSGGQMLDYIISHGRLKEKHARKFARQIASAIDYCHRNSIVHRDLKIENILISANGNIKLIDFGLSNLYSPRSHLSTFCGSLYFAAPELLNAQPYTGPEVDLWSFGVVLYVLVCGKVPFDDQSMPALHAKIKRGHVEYPSWLSSECKHLLSRLLVVNPLRRATMGEVIRHPWTCKGYGDLGIPTSFLPERTPLVSPDQIDRAVVREMSQYIGFGFGTEEEIRLGLEAILTEDWYRCWLKDKLSPQIDVVRGQVQEDISRAQATQSAVDVAADQLGNVGVKGLAEGSSHVPLPNALSQSLTSAESASGTTLTNPNDTNAAAARLGSAGAPAVSGPQAAAIQQSQAAPANSTISQRLAAQTSDLQNSDAVKKKTSFWKRSSTFITTNIGRTSSKQYSPDPHVPGGQAGEKSQGAAQFRVLSGRAFGDLRSSASQDNTAGQKEYGKPSSAHAPQMYIDPTSGMVAVWRDGKLAPPDTDCASIQHEYHDLLATDPLLSIYFLVKERRDRESRAQAQFNAAVRQAEAHASKPGTEIDAQAVPQLAGPDGPAAVPEKRHYLQQQQSQPLPRRPSDHKHELRSRTSTMTSSESYGVGRDATGSRNPQNAGLDIAASLAEPRGKESGLHRMSADIGRHAAMPSVPEEPVNTEDPTTAAIEALSSHTPPGRGSLALTATNSSANAATAMSARPDTKKKRASLFKRFSTLVKGGRNEQKPFDTPPGSNTRLSTNEDREDVGFVEIAHEAKAKESDKLLAAQAAASTQEVPASVASTVAKPAALAAQPVHKYQALHCIEEDDEDPRDTGDHQTNAGTDMATNGTGSKDGSEVAAKDESPDTASSRRQYLTKPLISGEKPASEPSEAWQSTDLAPSCNSSRGRLDLDSPSQVPPPSKPLIPPMHPSIQRAGLGKSAAKEQRAETGDSLDPPTDAKDSDTPADNKPTGAREGSAIDEQSKASRSSNEFDAASSMFTGTDIDDYEVITQSSLADHAAGPDRQGFDGIMAGKAELVEKARREIESMDEQEGVGLLDQTPELSYRITSSNARHSAFDAKKSRVRSSSNAMARVISDIVRDGKSASSGQRAGTKAKLQRNGKQIKEDGQPLLTQRHSFMNVAQHNSTGAIDSSNTGVKIPTSGSGSIVQGVGLGLVQVEETTTNPFEKPGKPSGLLRSHSHPQDTAKRHVVPGFDLPDKIAEVPEPTTPVSGDATEGIGARLRSETISIAGSATSAGPAEASAHASRPVSNKERNSPPPIDLPEIRAEEQQAAAAAVEGISKAPRADEYLKSVSLKALFSATTTSTRSPSEIRAGLINVMSTMRLRFHEGKGYFTCSMVTSVGPTNLQDAVYPMHADAVSKNSGLHKSMRLGGIDRKLSFRRRRHNRHEDKAGLIDSEAPMAVPGGGSGPHSIAESGVSESREVAVAENAKGISVCFQIFMVRVPLLQLYGLQFRRVSGPTWKYKDICSEILERLKL